MRIAVTAVMFAMASVLLAAGLEKARHFASFVSTLRDLGVARHARAAAVVVIALELAVALAIVFRPSSAWTVAGVLALAASFAIAGVIALVRRENIRCSCFGLYGNSTLGRHQLLQLPLWIAGAAVLASREPVSAPSGLTLFVAISLTLAALRLAVALRAALRARGDRRSAEEMYVWLR